MIVIGYQGIGKSTLAKNDKDFIDLESSNFYVDGVRADNWYVPYCNIAEHLSQQGYTVFVSSHSVVRFQLQQHCKETVVCCAPSLELKDEWIAKLKARYNQTGSEKDYRAWKNAEDCYCKNVDDILEYGFRNIIIRDMEYDLRNLLTQDEATYYSCTEATRRHMNAELNKLSADLKNTAKYREQAKYYKRKYHALKGKLNRALDILNSTVGQLEDDNDT